MNPDRKPNVCKYCGREFNHPSIGTMFHSTFGGETDGYCSQKCWDDARAKNRENEQRKREEQKQKRLLLLKKQGRKTLAKWEKEIKKRNDWIEKLNIAMRGDNPDTIAIAINGGVFEQLWHTIKTMVFTIGVAAILVSAVYAYMKISGIHGEGHSVDSAEKTAEIVNEQPPLVDSGVVDRTLDVTLTKETTTAEAQTESKATSAEVAAPTIEIDATPINK